jgi:AraC-like DNA-binding protein
MIDPHPLVLNPPHARLWQRSARRHQAYRPSVHAELVVLHATKGEARYVIGGRVLRLRAGSLLLAWAGEAHFLARDTPDFDMWVGLISERFSVGRCDLPPVDGGGLKAEARGLRPEVSTGLATLARTVQDAPSRAAWEVGCHWWQVQAWAAWQAAPEAGGVALHPAVARAAEALQRDPTLGARALGEVAGLSAGRLGQVFTAQMGESLVAFRTRQKLQRVEDLVSGQELDLLNAALEAGFGSYAQFFRAYRARYRVSPREGLLTKLGD